MWWALLWALIIGSISDYGSGGVPGNGALLAFFVIWYFAWKADTLAKEKEVLIEELSRASLR